MFHVKVINQENFKDVQNCNSKFSHLSWSTIGSWSTLDNSNCQPSLSCSSTIFVENSEKVFDAQKEVNTMMEKNVNDFSKAHSLNFNKRKIKQLSRKEEIEPMVQGSSCQSLSSSRSLYPDDSSSECDNEESDDFDSDEGLLIRSAVRQPPKHHFLYSLCPIRHFGWPKIPCYKPLVEKPSAPKDLKEIVQLVQNANKSSNHHRAISSAAEFSDQDSEILNSADKGKLGDSDFIAEVEDSDKEDNDGEDKHKVCTKMTPTVTNTKLFLDVEKVCEEKVDAVEAENKALEFNQVNSINNCSTLLNTTSNNPFLNEAKISLSGSFISTTPKSVNINPNTDGKIVPSCNSESCSSDTSSELFSAGENYGHTSRESYECQPNEEETTVIGTSSRNLITSSGSYDENQTFSDDLLQDIRKKKIWRNILGLKKKERFASCENSATSDLESYIRIFGDGDGSGRERSTSSTDDGCEEDYLFPKEKGDLPFKSFFSDDTPNEVFSLNENQSFENSDENKAREDSSKDITNESSPNEDLTYKESSSTEASTSENSSGDDLSEGSSSGDDLSEGSSSAEDLSDDSFSVKDLLEDSSNDENLTDDSFFDDGLSGDSSIDEYLIKNDSTSNEDSTRKYISFEENLRRGSTSNEDFKEDFTSFGDHRLKSPFCNTSERNSWYSENQKSEDSSYDLHYSKASLSDVSNGNSSYDLYKRNKYSPLLKRAEIFSSSSLISSSEISYSESFSDQGNITSQENSNDDVTFNDFKNERENFSFGENSSEWTDISDQSEGTENTEVDVLARSDENIQNSHDAGLRKESDSSESNSNMSGSDASSTDEDSYVERDELPSEDESTDCSLEHGESSNSSSSEGQQSFSRPPTSKLRSQYNHKRYAVKQSSSISSSTDSSDKSTHTEVDLTESNGDTLSEEAEDKSSPMDNTFKIPSKLS